MLHRINILPGHPPPPTYLPRLLLPGTSTTGQPPSPQNTLLYSAKQVQCTRWIKGTYNGVHKKMNKYSTIPDESLGGQHSRDGCQSLPWNADILQVRHTLPLAQCFYNAVLHSPGGCRGSRPNAEAVTAVLPLIEAGLPQCPSNHHDKARSCQRFLTLK